jgi:pimeloyl-ACP methyl ester carboxylesterase
MIPAAGAMRHRYRELSMPLVIMAGREDKVAKVGRQSVRLHEEIPHSSIRLVPNVGHMLHYAPARHERSGDVAILSRPGTRYR